jgi:tetrahydromethanopterin S-methyltransferase subunit G|tara:strand:+ start:604 stop:783 length:180 start_codon:yes stop_codon:yes gene_type:complete
MGQVRDKDEILRRLDEADNMSQMIVDLASKKAIDTNEAVRRLNEIRRRIQFAMERISIQ